MGGPGLTSTSGTSGTSSIQLAQSTTQVSSPNAILGKLTTTGASSDTAAADGLPGGVASSRQMALTDRENLLKFKEDFIAVGNKYGIPPAILAGIASRETRGVPTTSGAQGYGLMQVNPDHPGTTSNPPGSRAHIDQAARIFKGQWDQVKKDHPDWPPELQLRGAIAAYNMDASNVRTREGIDKGTHGNDYSADIWERAKTLAPDFGGAAQTRQVQFPAFSGEFKPAPTLADVRTGGKRLQIGDEGESVKYLQDLLVKQGLLKPEVAQASPGRFTPEVREAVWKFQDSKGLNVPAGLEGVVGGTSLGELEKAAGVKPQPDAPAVQQSLLQSRFEHVQPRPVALS